MNELTNFLIESILSEADSVNKVIVVYSGRFQPFHKGHYATYDHLVKKFGKDNVYVGTSNKTDNQKSPFDFKEKKAIMTKMFGIPSNKIVMVKNPYAPSEILNKYDEDTTGFITVVGEKDEARLGGKYFEPYKGKVEIGFKDKGYVYISPAQPNAISGTDVRNWLSKGTDDEKRKNFLKAYPKFDETIYKFVTLKLKKINENMPGGAGVGVSLPGGYINGAPNPKDVKKLKKKLDKDGSEYYEPYALGGGISEYASMGMSHIQHPIDREPLRPEEEMDLDNTITEIPMADLVKIDSYADKQLNPIDVVLTDKHFFDRLQDPRNNKEISAAELTGFFKRLAKNKKKFFEFLNQYGQVVAKDNRSKINIPFMKQANKIIAKTIMRKDGFQTTSPQYQFEDITEANAVSGGKVNKFITGKNLTLKGKKYSDIHFELVSIDNNKQIVKLRVLAPKEIFGQEINIDFRTLRRGPFLKTNTNVFENITLPVKVGDTILMGKFKNKKVVVKSIGKDEHGMPTINGKKATTFRIIKENIEESKLLTEGGAYGHMNHPFDIEMNLTFGDLKNIVTKALNGDLELAREKTDGQALAISWVNGRLVAARNKSHLKSKGKDAMDINAVAAKFGGRGGLTDAYNFAMKDLSTAIGALSQAQRDKIFKGGSCFMNLEVIYPTSVNVIPYGQPLLVFHGTFEYDEAGNIIGENQQAAKILAGMIKQINGHVQSKYTIQGPPVTKLPKSEHLSKQQAKYLAKISKLQSEFGLADNQGVAEYHQAWWTNFVNKNAKGLDELQKIGLVKRWAFLDKTFRIKDIKDDKIRAWAEQTDKQDQQKISKQNLMKFEEVFLGVGADVLSFMSSVLTANPDAAKRQMVSRLESTIQTIQKKGDPKQVEKLKLELQRLNSLGGFDKIVPNEGIVFVYGGNTYKLTGAFAPLNQILGIFYEN